jgi:hypothetical protein
MNEFRSIPWSNRLFIAGSHTLYAIYVNTRGAVDY